MQSTLSSALLALWPRYPCSPHLCCPYRILSHALELSETCCSPAIRMLTQVTRDKLLREHLYSETVDIGKETGSGYPGGVQHHKNSEDCLVSHSSSRVCLVMLLSYP